MAPVITGLQVTCIPATHFLLLSSVIYPLFTVVSIQLTDSFTLACENGYMDGQAGFLEEAKTMTVTSLGTKLTLKDWDQSDDREERKVEPADVKRVLEQKRWQAKDGPFRGFGSPPGRF